MQDHFYHYTSYQSLLDIFNANGNYEQAPGLKAGKRFIKYGNSKELPDKAHSGVIWGMLETRPLSFTELFWHEDQSFFEDCLEKSKGHLQPTILLKANLLPQDDVCVADWGVHLREEFKGTSMDDRKIVHEVKAAYWDSLVPLRDYGVDKQHKIPEVICFNDIPEDRLEINTVIPGSEMERYINTGHFDPEVLEQDKIKHDAMGKRVSSFLKKRIFSP